MPWLDDPIAVAMTLPPLAVPLLVFGSAFLEYVFPPWWGDSLVLLGFFLAAQGAASPPLVFAAAVTGSALGAAAAYGLGRRYGLALLRRMVRRRRSQGRRRSRELFQRFGERVLLVNRFLPVVRGAMLYGAGAMKLRFWPAFLYTNVSNLAFMALLMWVGLLTAGSWPEVLAAAKRYNQLLGLVVLAAVGVWIVAALARLRPPRASAGG